MLDELCSESSYESVESSVDSSSELPLPLSSLSSSSLSFLLFLSLSCLLTILTFIPFFFFVSFFSKLSFIPSLFSFKYPSQESSLSLFSIFFVFFSSKDGTLDKISSFCFKCAISAELLLILAACRDMADMSVGGGATTVREGRERNSGFISILHI